MHLVDSCLEYNSSNKPLEWTGHHHLAARTVKLLPATQGQRSADHVNFDESKNLP
jgi:hypothetical protein